MTLAPASTRQVARRLDPVARPASRGWRPSVAGLVPTVLALAGMVAMTYPTAASWVSQYNESQLIRAHTSRSITSSSTGAAEQLRLAHAYNDALSSGALLEANNRLPTGNGTSTNGSLDYDKLLDADASGVMARLRVPSIDADLPVYHGTSDATLAVGVGHLRGTSLPVGGAGTHAVLTGHRGLATATLFTNLNNVHDGDTFTIEVLGDVLTYKVIDTKVVDPDQTESLRPVAGRDLVTLVTCTPLGINSQRILVTGERITPTPIQDLEAAGSDPTVPHFPWWAALLAAGLLIVTGYAWRSGLPKRQPAKRAARRDHRRAGRVHP